MFVMAVLRHERFANSAEFKQRTVTAMGAIFAAATSIDETERSLRSKEHNRADWRSTLRYARVTQCTPNCDINRLRTPQNQIGTAFGTARVKATLLNY